ncbi:DUF4352 domain-containing protein [Listeria monocytogenes]|uniref:DUF4352 domain-containing protein n=1 Tax=Listeria monocytogenes TaxID=1639 RepID=UPI0011EB8756|nr:DUF4352 domain-containing protein [Listeria monocytogenes]EHD1589219.1 DUF4352 domain-containing protein [Listeria monocytogenes]TYV30955.1 DUF4352 domain-containing protein [Listeria monocytogenes]HAO6015964.1 DUF4352 domain-containing protein [Listeria monocytogenes]HBC0574171.1 DUF4352 domain-containing protein [Listeria monocytogenes]
MENENKRSMSKKQKIVFLGIIIVAISLLMAIIIGWSTNEPMQNSSLAKTYKIGDKFKYNGVQLKVNKVKYSEGTEYNIPEVGYEYVIVNVTITNNSGKTEGYDAFDFQLSDNGKNSNLDVTFLDEAIDALHSGTLLDGEAVTGDMVGKVKTGTKSLEIVYKPAILNGESVDIKLK